MTNKYYAVITGRVDKPTIYNNWSECKNVVHKYKGSKYRSFNTKREAQEYIDKSGIGYKSKSKNKKNHIVKIIGKSSKRERQLCIICEAPYMSKHKICTKCRHNIEKRNIKVEQLLFLKNKYNRNDIWELLKEDPEVLNLKYSNDEIKALIQTELHKIEDEKVNNEKYEKWESDIPFYILEIFKERKDIEMLALTGDKLNPKIHYRCKECGKECVTTYVKKMFKHNCTSKKSSGEKAVENFLNGKIGYLTQRKTLKCYNPITNSKLPYDFEIPSLKIIIEVQGEQHNMYVPYFHGSFENYEYQVLKDKIKKEFAEANGYSVVYLDYKDIKSGRFKDKLSELIETRKVMTY